MRGVAIRPLYREFFVHDDLITYLGRQVSKEGFRAFVYGLENRRRLVNSWEDFEAHLASGIWFASVDDIPVEDIKNEPMKGKRGKKGRE